MDETVLNLELFFAEIRVTLSQTIDTEYEFCPARFGELDANRNTALNNKLQKLEKIRGLVGFMAKMNNMAMNSMAANVAEITEQTQQLAGADGLEIDSANQQ